MDHGFIAALVGIIWLDLVLSGDNALIIAVIAQRLPDAQKRLALIFGTLLAAGLRIAGALIAAIIMGVPGLSLAIGAYLLYVAVSLLTHKPDPSGSEAKGGLFAAILAIALADIGMSLDNVFAVAALAHGDTVLMTIGIALSILLMMIGAALISKIIARFPILKWLGAGFLGWIAGSVMDHDPLVVALNDQGTAHWFIVPALGAACVLTLGLVFRTESEADHAVR